MGVSVVVSVGVSVRVVHLVRVGYRKVVTLAIFESELRRTFCVDVVVMLCCLSVFRHNS